MHIFQTPGATRLLVQLGRGDVTITATETDQTTVTVAGDHPGRVGVGQDGDIVSVIAPKERGLFGGPAYSIAVTLPEGSAIRSELGSADLVVTGTVGSLQARTGSGQIAATQVDGPAELSTGSGDVRLDRVAGDLSVKTGSGDLSVQHVGGLLWVKTGSGDITVGRALDSVRITTGSGDMALGRLGGSVETKTGSGVLRVEAATGELRHSTGSGGVDIREFTGPRLELHGASADMVVGIPNGTPVWTDINTVSGTLTSTVEGGGEPAPGEPYVAVRANTASGDITLIGL